VGGHLRAGEWGDPLCPRAGGATLLPLESCNSLQKNHARKKPAIKNFNRNFFRTKKLNRKKNPTKNFSNEKKSQQNFSNAKKIFKKILNAIIGRKKPGTRNPDYAIFYEIEPNKAFLYFHPCTRKSYSLK
jgi:hypothetical protein